MAVTTVRKYAQGTTTGVEASQTEAKRLLARYGAVETRITDAPGRAILEFVLRGRLVRFLVAAPVKLPNAAARSWDGDRAGKLQTDEYRRRWRALLLRLKAKLESVTNEDVAVEEEFLANLVVTEDGRTVGEVLLPQIQTIYEERRVPVLLP